MIIGTDEYSTTEISSIESPPISDPMKDEVTTYDFIDQERIDDIVKFINRKTDFLNLCNKRLEESENILAPYLNNIVVADAPIQEKSSHFYKRDLDSFNAHYKFENRLPITKDEQYFLLQTLSRQRNYETPIKRDDLSGNSHKLVRMLSKRIGKKPFSITKKDVNIFFLENYPHLFEAKNNRGVKLLKSCLDSDSELFISHFPNDSKYFAEILHSFVEKRQREIKIFSMGINFPVQKQLEDIKKECSDDLFILRQVANPKLRDSLINKYLQDIRKERQDLVSEIWENFRNAPSYSTLLKSALCSEFKRSSISSPPISNFTLVWLEVPEIKNALEEYNRQVSVVNREPVKEILFTREYFGNQILFHSTSLKNFKEILEQGSLDSLQSQLNKKGKANWTHSGKRVTTFLTNEEGRLKVSFAEKNVVSGQGKKEGEELNEICFTTIDFNHIYQDAHLYEGYVTFGLPSSSLKNYSFYKSDGLHLLDKEDPNGKPLSIDLDDLLIFTDSNNQSAIQAILKKKGKQWARDHLIINHLSKEENDLSFESALKLHSKFIENPSLSNKLHLLGEKAQRFYLVPTGRMYHEGPQGGNRLLYTSVNEDLDVDTKGS